jgi:hypothetical protein
MQFNIDSLIEIPMESIGGEEITPDSIDINGNNENKKTVSSVFEPNRLMQFTFDDLTFNNIQYGTIGAGPYKILNAATVFQTLNANARNFQSESLAYQYQQAGVPISSSVNEPLGTIQMVTASNIEIVGGTPIQSNGFLLSGSNTLFTAQEGPVTNTLTITTAGAGSSGQTAGTALATTTITGTGTGLTVDTTVDTGAITSVTVNSGGTGYAFGDTVKISSVNSQVLTVKFISIAGADSNEFLPFATSASVNEAPVPEDYRLEMAGPQLALYHTYNKLIESQSAAPIPPAIGGNCPSNPLPQQSQLWVKSGLDPRDTDNYYTWYPSGSNCANYADYQQPFLINRGDVIRAEGVREIFVANSQPSQSLAFNKDFTVLSVQNYTNSSSLTPTTAGGFIDNSAAVLASGPTTANAATVVFDDTQFQTAGSGTGGTLSLTSTASSKFYINISSGFFIVGSSSGYSVGDVITITSGVLGATAFGSTFGSISITLNSSNVEGGAGFGTTGFTLKVDDGCWSGITGGNYVEQQTGLVQTVTPTFLEVTPDPLVALNGLDGGAITKFTVRRELEQDNRVMARSVQAPSGSLGTRTQSGGGYLIPNDLTLQQKENAVNIINQLRAKNAFPGATPNATTQGS